MNISCTTDRIPKFNIINKTKTLKQSEQESIIILTRIPAGKRRDQSHFLDDLKTPCSKFR